MQTKKHSIIETISQTLIGLGSSIAIQVVLYPLMGIPVTLFQNVIITIVFFVVSLIRGYCIRRYFNNKTKQ